MPPPAPILLTRDDDSQLAKVGAELDTERRMRKEADTANQALLSEAS